ncbi:hypothetical protein [Magnetospirillum sp. SS-4]|uniref:hypothetical protein n=1 Tax=Magnetospirillum sp. SS-4 TaxID=2681465 RepID=UPI00137E3EA0|nr:hypothetical protein [Magnetospirillum sp. SS-4]CAA7613719.1 conserved hypothetical protein [Magnetospirillum sp. SS-4]
MGFIDRQPSIAPRLMTPSDYIWLAALGCAERGPITIEDVGLAVEALAGPLWSPTGQVVFDTVEALVEHGHLSCPPGEEKLSLTGSGRRRLLDLLTQPVPAPLSAFGQAGLRLKLAFLDVLPPILRRHQINGIIHAYECEMAARASRCAAWPFNGPLGRKWLDHHMDGLEDGLALLRRMAREEEPKLG